MNLLIVTILFVMLVAITILGYKLHSLKKAVVKTNSTKSGGGCGCGNGCGCGH